MSAEYAVSQLPEFHQHFAGLNEKQAELDFVEEAQKLPEYGIHFYKVQAVSWNWTRYYPIECFHLIVIEF